MDEKTALIKEIHDTLQHPIFINGMIEALNNHPTQYYWFGCHGLGVALFQLKLKIVKHVPTFVI